MIIMNRKLLLCSEIIFPTQFHQNVQKKSLPTLLVTSSKGIC
nr:MAG TPA: hypothetical protein [Caudoviricetes sp.]